MSLTQISLTLLHADSVLWADVPPQVGLVSLCRGQHVALDVARGIHALHIRNMVHCDIKVRTQCPPNMSSVGDCLFAAVLASEHCLCSSCPLPARCHHNTKSGTMVDTDHMVLVNIVVQSPNILLSRNYDAKVADVGLARPLFNQYGDVEAGTGTGSCRGTWEWQAPECLLGSVTSTSADIYRLPLRTWPPACSTQPALLNGLALSITPQWDMLKLEIEC